MIKKLFGGKKESAEQQYTIDDLIVLERYGDAEQRIHEDLKFRPNDLNLHLKLRTQMELITTLARQIALADARSEPSDRQA